MPMIARIVRLRSRIYLVRARIQTRLHGGGLVIGAGVQAQVPLRVNGPGKVAIADAVALGERMAPRMGDGTILLQARFPEAAIRIGARSCLSNNISIISTVNIELGDECLVGDQVCILDSDFHEVDPKRRRSGTGRSHPVIIGNNVWLGSRVMVLKGVRIGHNTVIAAGSIVTEPIPANVVAAGVPARVVKELQ